LWLAAGEWIQMTINLYGHPDRLSFAPQQNDVSLVARARRPSGLTR
jgi:hypothetical protein